MNRLLVSAVLLSPTVLKFRTIEKQKQLVAPVETLFPVFKSRSQHLQEVKQTLEYDIVIIGGGCTGAGVVLDAASRGYKCLLLEGSDFASGASSKSTKLIHGGVRYLQQVFELSWASISSRLEKFYLVREALEERTYMINNAPYMNHKISIVIPCKNSFQSLYYYIGSIAYHMIYWLFNKTSVGVTFNFPYFASRNDLRQLSPYISDKFGSGVVYEDGQFNDSQMNMALLLTSTVPHAKFQITPANILNRALVTKLHKENGRISGVTFKDTLTGEETTVKCKYVVNCTGVWADKIRQLDDPAISKRIIPVAGSHMTYSKKLVARNAGICMASSDGRILLVLPWLGKTIVGTTEKTYEEPMHNPIMSFEEKEFITNQILNTFDKLTIHDLEDMHSSSWTGLRPLVLEKGATSTKNISRKHVVEESDSGMFSLMGGKWTTYRRMAQDLMDEIAKDSQKRYNRPYTASNTKTLKLIGSNYSDKQRKDLHQEVWAPLVDHLFSNYGGLAVQILNGNTQMLDPETCISKAQIDFIVKNTMPTTIEDVLIRRTRIALLDNAKVKSMVPYIAQALARHNNWSAERKSKEVAQFYQTFDKLMF